MPTTDSVKILASLVIRIDAWAHVQGVDRSEAILRLIDLGLSAGSRGASLHGRGDRAIEQLAVQQLNLLIDPDTPQDERDRRIHRLTEGPPEFVNLRIDLPPRETV